MGEALQISEVRMTEGNTDEQKTCPDDPIRIALTSLGSAVLGVRVEKALER